MSPATDSHIARQSARGGTRDEFPGAVADQEDRCGDGEHEQRQRAELEQETGQLLVRLRLFELRSGALLLVPTTSSRSSAATSR